MSFLFLVFIFSIVGDFLLGGSYGAITGALLGALFEISLKLTEIVELLKGKK
ncbi:hypothetical protein [Tepidibacter sp. Z1-5]|uniref:hypothetical protein n=1 Tax=Tepidibacter sp. Z1-5 TaxID=3134138 RepID=UPI0030BA7052